jgi:hypothetical protein
MMAKPTAEVYFFMVAYFAVFAQIPVLLMGGSRWRRWW